MKKLSIKLGILFFIIIFGLLSSMFFFLHIGIADNRIEEELHALQARGNSHKVVLEKHFTQETIAHVVLMESESTTDVVIVDPDGEVLGASGSIQKFEKYLTIPTETKILEDNWQEEPYIATVSPIGETGQIKGYVFMFENTKSVHSLMESLNEHFLLAGWVSVFFTVIIIIFLSKGITKPLLKMKEATYQISKGDFSVSLPITSKDELGDLANSIETLATELSYLKEQRNEFLASISHELRTPLTYIKGYADIVSKRNLSDEERNKYLNIIKEETDRLTGLIKELFDLAQMDQNTFVIEKERIQLSPFLKKLEEKITRAFEQEFKLSCEPNIEVIADPVKLEQILINLLDNARKYSAKGSTVKLEAWKNRNSTHIVIADNGKGIPEKDLPYIFNRFYRVEKSRTRSLGGTGLGLAIVQELVHAHGGEITVTSIEHHGTRFEIIFKGE
ncbi:sensor histidine kinase [Robertmurraya kyonggiensis]|uniref:histidine kinase n=1 Tax=Robertmurraya kyonggiensis TaxID=1037680 RepID=A0A4U1D4J4_9BACI|nr:ATP-binding protein [Robertmurraya kyonggiensis]TKC17104.1 cell wall metabolism sensor histidine kinase WalK [Robertmurraya kyonggiensis]